MEHIFYTVGYMCVTLNDVVKALNSIQPNITPSRAKVKVLNGIGDLMVVLSPEEREKVLMRLAKEVNLESLRSLEKKPRERLMRFWSEAKKKLLVKPKLRILSDTVIIELMTDDLEYAEILGNTLRATIPELEHGDIYVYAGEGEDDYLVWAKVKFKSEDSAKESVEVLEAILNGDRSSPNGGV